MKSPIFLLKMDEAVLPPDMVHEIINWADMPTFRAFMYTCRAGYQYCRKIVKKKIKEWVTIKKRNNEETMVLPNGFEIFKTCDLVNANEYIYRKLNGNYVNIIIIKKHTKPRNVIFHSISICDKNYKRVKEIVISCNNGSIVHYIDENNSFKFEETATMAPFDCSQKDLKKLIKTFNIKEYVKNSPNYKFSSEKLQLDINLIKGHISYGFNLINENVTIVDICNRIKEVAGPEIAENILFRIKRHVEKNRAPAS